MIKIETKIPTVNNCYGFNKKIGRRYLNDIGKDFKQLISDEVRLYLYADRGFHEFPVFPEGRVYLRIKSYFIRRGRDRDNPVKFVQDALKGIVVKDDSQFYDGPVQKEDDKSIVKKEMLELEFYSISSKT
jgi:Holliday junction resolvase RusA-like endonuclease